MTNVWFITVTITNKIISCRSFWVTVRGILNQSRCVPLPPTKKKEKHKKNVKSLYGANCHFSAVRVEMRVWLNPCPWLYYRILCVPNVDMCTLSVNIYFILLFYEIISWIYFTFNFDEENISLFFSPLAMSYDGARDKFPEVM